MAIANSTVNKCSVVEHSKLDAKEGTCEINSYVLYYQRTCDFKSCRSKVCKMKAKCDHPYTITQVEGSNCEFLGAQQDLVGLSIDDAAGFGVTSSWTFKRAIFLAMSNPGYHVSFTLEKTAAMQVYFCVMMMEDSEKAQGDIVLETFHLPQESAISLEPMAHSNKQSQLLSHSFSSWTSTIHEPETVLNFNQDDSCHFRLDGSQVVGATRNPLEMKHTQAFIAADLVRRVSLKKGSCEVQASEASEGKRGCFRHICRSLLHSHRKSKFPQSESDVRSNFDPPQISLHFEHSARPNTWNLEHESGKLGNDERGGTGGGSSKMKIHKKYLNIVTVSDHF
eukprot:212906-Hanusia_phi.AAC.2